VGTGFSIHISRSPSVKGSFCRARTPPTLSPTVYRHYVTRHDRRMRTLLVLSMQLR
jgi:hypothetical protein